MKTKKPILLAILDGWGIAEPNNGNAVYNANMKFIEELKSKYPWVKAHASGKWVGLPEGQMGNSEVGHIHLGSGRISMESLVKLNYESDTNNMINNDSIISLFEYVMKNNSNLHIMGLFSDGGVHSHMKHAISIYKSAVDFGIKNIYFDLITDGRDTVPKNAINYINELNDIIKSNNNIGKIASISGRYYAMDRDKRFDRLSDYYETVISRKSENKFSDPIKYINDSYENNLDDEMIKPAFNEAINDSNIQENDGLIFFNFRPDRAIQISSAISNKNYLSWQSEWFNNSKFIGDKIHFITMTKYSDDVKPNTVAYPSEPLKNTLGDVISQNGMKQLRIAETEKIAHITFFFDGGNDYFKNGLAKKEEIKLKNSDIDLIPSKKVATYDLKPEMSCVEITDKLLEEINKDEYDLIILNFANCDMVGHTGNNEAAIIACKSLDSQLERIYNKLVVDKNGIMIITADHGNAEIMIDENGNMNKKHTTSLVPIIITDNSIKLDNNDPAIVRVSPTILDLLEIKKPEQMTEKSLIIEKN